VARGPPFTTCTREALLPDTITILFETHATSVDNEAGVASGWRDAELSATGEAQAAELGARHRARAPAAVYCSDLRRAYRTVEIAFAGQRVALARDRRLRECDYGALTGMAVADLDAIRSAHVRAPFPAGESYADVVRRVEAWLGEAEQGHPGETLLVVGHRATWFALEHLLRGVPLERVVAEPWRWQPGWQYEVRVS
jgi:broad specificity phosphatase PhoE